ncbi:MAG: glutamate racemase [Bacillota bacterium]|nr:glutamate racemase [Bacillota bacterium]
MDTRPIGVIDSGLGGLTAVRRMMRIMPEEDIIYFGDTGRVPYGTRSKETVIKYTKQDIAFLRTFDIKAIVVACGTMSSAALELISGEYDIPIIGVVRSASQKAAALTKNKKIGVIATQGTITSGAYTRVIGEYLKDTEIYEKACPLFVPLVENGRFRKGDLVVEEVVREYLTPIKESGADTLILGCTHYPLLFDVISDFLGEKTSLVDSGAESAEYARSVLKMTEKQAPLGRKGRIRYFVSDSPESFTGYASLFLGEAGEYGAGYVDIEKF